MIPLKSEITRKLLNYFFINPHESLYVNELVRKLKVDKRNLAKKLRELEKEGILGTQERGNLKLYSINKKYPLYNEYRKIMMKIGGFEEELKEILKGIEGVKEAYIYGSYARNKLDAHSDIDLLIVGNQSIIRLQKKLSEIQRKIGREINAVNMDEKEFQKKIRNKDPFVCGILKQRRIRLI